MVMIDANYPQLSTGCQAIPVIEVSLLAATSWWLAEASKACRLPYI